MALFDAIRQMFFPETPTLSQLAHGLCALPMPRERIKAPVKKKAADMYVIDQDRNQYGFHTATAINQNEGSGPDLTGYDIELLKERTYWGGKKVAAKNEQAKAYWHTGKTEREAAAMLGVSDSWVEKRFGTFSTALLQEKGECADL